MYALDNIAKECGVTLEHYVPASALTSFKGGGVVKNLLVPKSADNLATLMKRLNGEEGVKPFLLGGGSNVIFADGEITRPVISLKQLNGIEINGGIIKAECGVSIAELIAFARKYQLGGLEFLSGIPATVGGIIKMNAGAFGAKTADYLVALDTLTADYKNNVRVECCKEDFSYRRGYDGIVLGGEFKLEQISRDKSLEKANGYLKQRAYKQPNQPSCGSVFKNPQFEGAKPAAVYIDQCGLKGERRGGAEISEKHANFIVNIGGASADDFLRLVTLIKESVQNKFAVVLEEEFVLLKQS